jgi:hypothetical protein
MSSVTKSVVCSYCHTRGHNRQTCPQLSADVKRIEDQHGTNHPVVIKYKASRASISQSASKRAKMPRSCTYCHTLGHNRRTCAALGLDRELAIAKNAFWCDEYLSNIKELGLGIGAMVRMPRRQLHRHAPSTSGDLWMVLEHDWQRVNYINDGERGVLLQQISNVGRRTWLSAHPGLKTPSLAVTGWEVVSPSYDFGAPPAWASGAMGIKSLFENHDQESRVI